VNDVIQYESIVTRNRLKIAERYTRMARHKGHEPISFQDVNLRL